MPITFQSQNTPFSIKHKLNIKKWLNAIVSKEKKKIGELNFVFTNDEELLKFNQNYLQHHTLTDIITFDSSSHEIINGDVIISIERVEENAGKFKVAFETELHRVLAHGVLHLLGYKDKSKKDILEMRAQEEKAIKLLKF